MSTRAAEVARLSSERRVQSILARRRVKRVHLRRERAENVILAGNGWLARLARLCWACQNSCRFGAPLACRVFFSLAGSRPRVFAVMFFGSLLALSYLLLFVGLAGGLSHLAGWWVLLPGDLACAFGCLVSGLLFKRCFQVLLAAG